MSDFYLYTEGHLGTRQQRGSKSGSRAGACRLSLPSSAAILSGPSLSRIGGEERREEESHVLLSKSGRDWLAKYLLPSPLPSKVYRSNVYRSNVQWLPWATSVLGHTATCRPKSRAVPSSVGRAYRNIHPWAAPPVIIEVTQMPCDSRL